MICVFFSKVDKLNHTLYTALLECDKHFTSATEYNEFIGSLSMGARNRMNVMFF